MRKVFLAAALVAVLVGGMATTASATGEVDVSRVATPTNVCSELVSWGAIGADTYGDCLALLRDGAAVEPFPDAGLTFIDRCQQLEAGIEEDGEFFQLTYPFVFHAGEGDPMPDLRANNTRQCSRALYAFHTIETEAILPVFEGGAEPAAPFEPAGRQVYATAANACKELVSWGAIGGHDYYQCLEDLKGGANFPPGEGAPTFLERCALLEEGVTDPFPLEISYPYVFHTGRYDLMPDLSADNRKQCSRALYVFHTLEAYIATLGAPTAA